MNRGGQPAILLQEGNFSVLLKQPSVDVAILSVFVLETWLSRTTVSIHVCILLWGSMMPQ